MTQFRQQFTFQCFHFFRFGVVDVVVAEQVQAAVDHQVGPVGLQRLALFQGFAGDHRGADHQVAEQRDIEKLVRDIGGKDSTLVA